MHKEPVTPCNYEAEEAIISCLLFNWRHVPKIIDRLCPEHFYDAELAMIYSCIVDLYQCGKHPTIPCVADEVARRMQSPLEVGQVAWELEGRTMNLATLYPVEDYVEGVIRASQNRRLLQAAQRITVAAYQQEEQSVQLAEELIMAIVLGGDLRGMTPFPKALDAYLASYTRRREQVQAGKPLGVKTGLCAIDALIGGFRPGTLNILAARTSTGKTSLALTVALAVAKQALTGGGEVAFFSLEMRQEELVQRLLAMDIPLDQSLLRDGQTTEQEHAQVLQQAEALRPIGLHIADAIYSLEKIRSHARILCARHMVDLIIVDYIQLVDRATGEVRGARRIHARYEELGEISKGLKRLAQELEVPVLALAQLSRESEHEEEPHLRHLGESGRLENDADLVAFLSCPTSELAKRHQALPYRMHFWVRKHRNGRVGKVTVRFQPHLTRFDNAEGEA